MISAAPARPFSGTGRRSTRPRGRARVGGFGAEGVEWLLTRTIRAGHKSGAIDGDSVRRVAVDTTVMEKTIAQPTDARLYGRARSAGGAGAGGRGWSCGNPARALPPGPAPDWPRTGPGLALQVGPGLALQVGRYAHARQFKRMRKALKKPKGHTGRVMRDLRRHVQDIPKASLRDRITGTLALVSQLLHQAPKGAGKIYALHEPEVDCISSGKARVRCAFGCKVSIATALDEGFVVGMRGFPGNPYDGRTLKEALEQVAILTGQRPDPAVVDRGFRGHGEDKTRVPISGTRRGLTPKLIADLRRRSANEPGTGHMKTDGRLAGCRSKGTVGDALSPVLCACGLHHPQEPGPPQGLACPDIRRLPCRQNKAGAAVPSVHASLMTLIRGERISGNYCASAFRMLARRR